MQQFLNLHVALGKKRAVVHETGGACVDLRCRHARRQKPDAGGPVTWIEDLKMWQSQWAPHLAALLTEMSYLASEMSKTV